MTALVRTANLMRVLPAPYVREGWGILNHVGELWSDDLFDTPEKAQAHVELFWGVNHPGIALESRKKFKEMANRYRYVRVRRTVVISPDPEQNGVRVTIAKSGRESSQ